MDINKNEVSHDNKAVCCVYTSVGVNHFSGCSSILAVSPPLNPSRLYNILAFGSSHTICLSKLSTPSLNDEMMIEVNTKQPCMDKFCIYQTLFGHTSDVRCIRWLNSCGHCSSISKIYSHSICFLMSADNSGTIIVWACSTNHLLHSDQLNNSQFIMINKFQVPKNSTINSIDGFFFPASNSSVHNDDQSCSGVLFLSAASDTSVYNWRVNIPEDLLKNTAVLLPSKLTNTITRNPSLCLCLKTFCVKYNITTNEDKDKMHHWLRFILLGLDNGQTEVWSMGLFNDDGDDDKESGANFTLGATLSGHQDWVRCMDVCIDEVPAMPVILIATGGQDSIVRLWRLFSMVNDTNKPVYEHTKNISLQLPEHFSADNLNLCLTSESVLAGHENWVTGISWSSTTTDHLFPPNLLTCSMDKSLIVWDPPSENSKESSPSSDVCSLWKEKARLGHFGDTGLSIMDCHWLPSDGSKIFGHTFQGSISIWCKSEKGFWLPALPLTGHVGPVADLTWMSLYHDEKITESNDSYTYLLTAGFDQTVRLHACQSQGGSIPEGFWYELARPQIHGYDMNAIASISPVLYASAGDEKVVRVFKTTKAFLKSFKQLYKSSTVRQKLDLILADNSLPTSAVQPPLGLSNQIVNATPENTNGNHNSVNNEYDVNHDEYVNGGKAGIINEESIYDEIPTEDRLQHATLWPEVKKLYGHPYEVRGNSFFVFSIFLLF
ncbi:unnamed protein product [Trichobilharzia szidati]|nr:unnamed protein product [Trichobilharzia szidati]